MNIVPVSEIQTMAVAVARSGLFGIKTPEQALALMLVAQAEGMHPAIAARDYHIIQGRPALKADAMLARFQAAGGTVKWSEMTDKRVAATFSHAQGGSVEIDWTIAMAERAGLMKNPTWKQYPRQMLRARCISEGIRTVFPGVVVGSYTPEEVNDFTPQQQMRDVTPQDQSEVLPSASSVLADIQAATSIDELNALRPAMKGVEGAIQLAKERAEHIRAIAAQEAATDPVADDDIPI